MSQHVTVSSVENLISIFYLDSTVESWILIPLLFFISLFSFLAWVSQKRLLNQSDCWVSLLLSKSENLTSWKVWKSEMKVNMILKFWALVLYYKLLNVFQLHFQLCEVSVTPLHTTRALLWLYLTIALRGYCQHRVLSA